MNICEEYLDITVDENEIIIGAKDIIKRIRPSWPLQQLHFKVTEKFKIKLYLLFF